MCSIIPRSAKTRLTFGFSFIFMLFSFRVTVLPFTKAFYGGACAPPEPQSLETFP